MAQLRIGRKTQLINASTLFPVTFYDNAYVVSTALAGTIMRVEGFGDFTLANLHTVQGWRGAVGVTETRRLDAGANFVVAGAIPPNTIVNAKFEITTDSYRSESVRTGRLGNERQYQLILQPGNTAEQVLAQLYNYIKAILYSSDDKIVTVPHESLITAAPYNAVLDANNQATTMDILDVFAGYTGDKMKIRFTDEQNFNSPYITYTEGAPFVSGDRGRNNFDRLKSIFVDTESRRPYDVERYSIPQPGILYSSLKWNSRVDRNNEGFGGGIVASQTDIFSDDEFELYVNEAACLPLQNSIVDFLNRATILSTANPARYDAPLFYSNALTPTAVAAAAFKV